MSQESNDHIDMTAGELLPPYCIRCDTECGHFREFLLQRPGGEELDEKEVRGSGGLGAGLGKQVENIASGDLAEAGGDILAMGMMNMIDGFRTAKPVVRLPLCPNCFVDCLAEGGPIIGRQESGKIRVQCSSDFVTRFERGDGMDPY